MIEKTGRFARFIGCVVIVGLAAIAVIVSYRWCMIQVADLFANQKKYSSAIKGYKKALTFHASDEGTLLKIAAIYFECDSLDHALIYAQKCLALNEKNPVLLKLLGDIYGSENDDRRAIDFYRKSLVLDSTVLNSYLNLASSYRNIRKYDSSLIWLDKAILVDARNSNAFKDRAFTYVMGYEAYNKALADYDYSIKLDSNNFAAIGLKGFCLEKMGKSKEAVEVWTYLKERRAGNIDSLNARIRKLQGS